MPQTRKDTLLVAAFSGVIVLSTLAPYVVHSARPIPGKEYTGIERFLTDQISYLMWANQVRRGRIMVTDLYVTELPERFPPHPLWAAIGLAGRGLPVSTVALYHGARVMLGFAYLLVLFKLAGRFCEDRLTQWVAWLLAALGGGAAWVYWAATGTVGLQGMWTTADYMPEMWSYSSLLYFPHFAAALLLLVGCVYCVSAAWRDYHALKAVAAGALLGLLTLIHPYTAVALIYVLQLHLIWWSLGPHQWRPVGPVYVITILSGLPFMAFEGWQVKHYEIMRLWAESNVMRSPSAGSYILGFGLIGLAAVIGLARSFAGAKGEEGKEAERPEGRLLVVWVLATAMLLFSHVKFERRCVEGLHIALCLLAAPVVVGAARRLAGANPRRAAVYAGLFVAACAPTSVWFLAREMPSQVGYVDAAIPHAEEAIWRRYGPGIGVLCQGSIGQWVPLLGRTRTYLGHGELSFGHDARAATVQRFFAAETTAAQRRRLLQQTRCGVVLAEGSQAAVLRAEQGVWEEVFREGEVEAFGRK